jgi:hypothetical protein
MIKNINYMENLSETIIMCNQKALSYGDGKAWDNKKAKTSRLSIPRGRIFRTLEGLESMKRLRILRGMANIMLNTNTQE